MMNHIIFMYVFFDICKYHDEMIIHYCVKVILYDSEIPAFLKATWTGFLLQNNSRKTPLEVRPW